MKCNVMVDLGLSLELKIDLGLEKAGDHWSKAYDLKFNSKFENEKDLRVWNYVVYTASMCMLFLRMYLLQLVENTSYQSDCPCYCTVKYSLGSSPLSFCVSFSWDVSTPHSWEGE